MKKTTTTSITSDPIIRTVWAIYAIGIALIPIAKLVALGIEYASITIGTII